MTALRVVTLAGEVEREAALAALLGERQDVDLVLRCVDRVELIGAIRGADLDAIVSVGAPVWLDRQVADEAARAGIPVVGVVADPLEADHLAGLGASLIPAAASVDEILDRCTRSDIAPPPPLPSTQPSTPHGRLIALWGPKGAPGRTSVAVELAFELARGEPETLLLDGDPYGGDVQQVLGVVEEVPTVVWAARMAAADELDAVRLALDLRRAGPDGPVFVPGVPRAALWAEVSEFAWRQLLTVVRALFRFTVCDVGFCLEDDAPFAGRGRNDMARVAVTTAHKVVAVCRSDPIGLKQFVWAFDELTDLVDPDEVAIVANRVREGQESEVADVLRRHTGKRPVAYLPDRPREFTTAGMNGGSVVRRAPRSDLNGAIRAIAAAVGGRVQPAGFLARLAGRTS